MIQTGIPHEFLSRLVESAASFNGPEAQAVQVWTGKPLVSFPTVTAENARRLADRARDAQVAWASVDAHGRYMALQGFVTLIRKHREKLIRLLQVFGGQSRFDAFDQYQDTYNSAAQYVKFTKKRMQPLLYHGAIPFVSRVRIERVPIGVIGMFTLTDYQLSYGAVDVLPALLAGNGVVNFVPAQAYPVTLALRELAIAAGLPEELWQVAPAQTHRIGQSVVDAFDHVTYIGNSATGVALQQQCLDASVATSMFMSVKNHAVVLSDADLETAVRSVAWQAFMNTGCSSVHIEKVHVDRSLYDTFVRELRSMVTRRIVIGANYDHRSTFGSLYSQHRLDRTREHLCDAIDLGAEVVCGGQHRADLGPWFHEPTVITNMPPEALAFDEETYGPLLSVEPFDHIDDVVDEITHSQYCYAMQLFTERMDAAQRVALASRAGFVSINDGYHMTWGAWNAPVQGSRDTGEGLRHGFGAIRQYTRSALTSRQMFYSGEPQANQSMATWEALSQRVLDASVRFHSL